MNVETMNVENLTKLANWLTAGAPHKHIQFNMEDYIELEDAHGNPTHEVARACGAVACMAGAAAQFFAPEVIKELLIDNGHYTPRNKGIGVFEIAAAALGLNNVQATRLFVPTLMVSEDITPQEAGAVVNHLIKTGEVDWRVAGFNEPY